MAPMSATAPVRAGTLPEEGEASLLCRESRTVKKLQSLLASQHLTPTHNAPMLVLNEIGLRKPSCRMLRGAMPNLGACANCWNVCGHPLYYITRF